MEKKRQQRNRRVRADRRIRTRGGRRSTDARQSAQCPECASADVNRIPVMPGVLEYRCRACEETWVSVSKHQSS